MYQNRFISIYELRIKLIHTHAFLNLFFTMSVEPGLFENLATTIYYRTLVIDALGWWWWLECYRGRRWPNYSWWEALVEMNIPCESCMNLIKTYLMTVLVSSWIIFSDTESGRFWIFLLKQAHRSQLPPAIPDLWILIRS